MGAARYDRRIEIQSEGLTEDDFGAEVSGWTPLVTVWAGYEAGSAAEKREAVAQESASLAATFTIRYSQATKGIKPKLHRILFEGSIWDIEGVSEGRDRRRELVLTAVSRL